MIELEKKIEDMTMGELIFECEVADEMRMRCEDAVRRAESDRDYYTERAGAMRRRLAEMRKK